MNSHKTIFLLVLAVFLFAGCKESHNKAIDTAYQLSATKPDIALKLLDGVKQSKLTKPEKARFALVYTIAQDKNGLDVDNDSLLRVAYTYYNNREDDSLYAKCEYYMGKYLALNDSSEKALLCFSKSAKAAKIQKDYATESMALFLSSRIIKKYAPKRALSYAKDVVALYNKVGSGSNYNKAQALLNLAECYYFINDSIKESRKYINQAIELAQSANDSTTLSNAYQDLSVYYGLIGDKSSLIAAKKSFGYNGSHSTSSVLSLAWAYYDVDSLQKSKNLALTIPRKEYQQHGSEIYFLLLETALKAQNYSKVSEYKDSLIASLNAENAANSKAKVSYYRKLISKERARVKAQDESQYKSTVIIAVTIVFTIVIAFVLYISHYRRKQIQFRNAEEQKRKQLVIEHQKKQMKMMRNYLMSKIDILQKLESLKNGDNHKVLLAESDWKDLAASLNLSGDDFVTRLRKEFPKLTKKDIRFLMLVKINLPYTAIAQIYHIEPKSVRQKLFLIKKKLGLEKSQESANDFIKKY